MHTHTDNFNGRCVGEGGAVVQRVKSLDLQQVASSNPARGDAA